MLAQEIQNIFSDEIQIHNSCLLSSLRIYSELKMPLPLIQEFLCSCGSGYSCLLLEMCKDHKVKFVLVVLVAVEILGYTGWLRHKF